MNSSVIFLIGTGSLSKAIVDTLSFSHITDITFYIYSRSYSASSWLAAIGNTRSRVSGNNQKFVAMEIDWESRFLLTDHLNLYQPELVIHAASIQSMWSLKQDNKWSKLVRETGYGVTMPLQCKLALAVSKAISGVPVPPLFINCCYPDAVNFVIKKCRLDVLCGIGNIGIIYLLLPDKNNLSHKLLMLANHFHLQELVKPPQLRTELPRLWIDKKEVDDPGYIFDKISIMNEPSLNSITSLTCLRLISVLLSGHEEILHLPGPHGQIGGYPVEFKNRRISYIGTKLIDAELEKNWNGKVLEKEGVLFGEDHMGFSEDAFKKISKHSKYLAKGFSFSDVNTYINDFLQLKEKLSM